MTQNHVLVCRSFGPEMHRESLRTEPPSAMELLATQESRIEFRLVRANNVRVVIRDERRQADLGLRVTRCVVDVGVPQAMDSRSLRRDLYRRLDHGRPHASVHTSKCLTRGDGGDLDDLVDLRIEPRRLSIDDDKRRFRDFHSAASGAGVGSSSGVRARKSSNWPVVRSSSVLFAYSRIRIALRSTSATWFHALPIAMRYSRAFTLSSAPGAAAGGVAPDGAAGSCSIVSDAAGTSSTAAVPRIFALTWSVRDCVAAAVAAVSVAGMSIASSANDKPFSASGNASRPANPRARIWSMRSGYVFHGPSLSQSLARFASNTQKVRTTGGSPLRFIVHVATRLSPSPVIVSSQDS